MIRLTIINIEEVIIMQTNEQQMILSSNTSFAAHEAYKTLRTNIIFSFTGTECKAILITSGNKGETKSTTALNLALTFVENRSRVLLIDCDLRMPTIAAKTGIRPEPGLSNYLAGLEELQDCIHHFDNGLSIMTAGTIPPNPTEMLGSAEMKTMIEEFRKQYDYIFLDAPPVNALSDTQILSQFADGTLIVVRNEYSTRESVAAAVKKLEFSGAKILGFALTDAKHSKFGYGKYGKYGKYRKYGYYSKH